MMKGKVIYMVNTIIMIGRVECVELVFRVHPIPL